MQNLEQTILSQYANSPVLLSLIQSANDCLDPSADIDLFYSSIWNIATATGYGLDVWGRIVNVSRILTIPITQTTIGFKEATTAHVNTFGHAKFYSGSTATTNFILPDSAYRLLILVKAGANISSGSIHAYNALLMQLFVGRGNAYVADNGNMVATLTFSFYLTPVEIAILKQSGAFVPPTGVSFLILDSAGYH